MWYLYLIGEISTAAKISCLTELRLDCQTQGYFLLLLITMCVVIVHGLFLFSVFKVGVFILCNIVCFTAPLWDNYTDGTQCVQFLLSLRICIHVRKLVTLKVLLHGIIFFFLTNFVCNWLPIKKIMQSSIIFNNTKLILDRTVIPDVKHMVTQELQ